MVSRVEDTESTSTSTSDLMVTNESDRLVLTWQGKGKVKGFILHRTEKGKDNYTPITSLINIFSQLFVDSAMTSIYNEPHGTGPQRQVLPGTYS